MSALRVHDVLVVGSGIGGLTAAALCAADGLDTIVLEGHTRPGGCAGDFKRRGVTFPAGATVVMGFEEGGLHRWIYERLGLPIRAERLDLAMQVHLPDQDVRITTDPADWPHEYRRAFPTLGPGGERFWSKVARLAQVAHELAGRRPMLPLASPYEVLDAVRLLTPALLPNLVPALPALWQTVGDLLRAEGIHGHLPHRCFIDNQLLISMQCLADESIALSGALALEVYRYGSFSLPAGTASIAQDLLTALEARGGRCHYRSWVRTLVRHGDYWIATTAEGEEYAARTVIANLPPAELAGLLGNAAPPSLAKAARRRQQPWGAVVLFAALNADTLPGPLPRYHQVVDSYDGAVDDGGSCFVSVFGPDPQDRTHHGARARLTVSTHTRVDGWWNLPDRPAYAEHKAAVGARLMRAAERAVPDLQQRLVFSEVATPRSYARWTGRHEGRVGGVPQTRSQANLLALSHRTGVPGLFLCGDSVFPGQGTIGVTLSGINAARSAVRAAGLAVRRRQVVVGGTVGVEPAARTSGGRS